MRGGAETRREKTQSTNLKQAERGRCDGAAMTTAGSNPELSKTYAPHDPITNLLPSNELTKVHPQLPTK